jgi:PAS domain S-box-containing protein
MNTWFRNNTVPLIQASLLFFVLFACLILATIYIDFSKVDTHGLLFLMSFLCCVFVAKNTYDLARATAERDRYNKEMSVDLAVASEQLYVKLYENSPVPYLIIDPEGEVKSANVSAVRLLGIAQTKIIGINIFNRLQSEDIERLDILIEKYRSHVPINSEMLLVKRDDKKEVWVLLSLFSYSNVLGERIGLLTLVDVTRQKRAEDAKSEFVSLASHQLRTPIAGMKWSAELLQMDNADKLTERQLKYIDRLLISIKRMATLVDDFLRVSRFELGTFQPDYTPVNLPKLFKDIISEQDPRVAQKNLSVRTFFDKSASEVICDSNLLRMIITNLFSNAVKYTRVEGTVHIGFSYKDGNVNITVADNGMGIPAEDQDQIFSKLFRASNAMRDVPDGTGLGLYIVKEAVSVLRGRITFTTTENVGTTFEVVLPLELADDKK